MNKKLLFIIIFLFSSYVPSTNYSNHGSGKNVKYIAYYFHRTARCTECLNLEAFTKELIDNKFSKKNISFISINVDEQENEHFEKDYNLEFSSVILAKFINDEQVKWKNVDSIWKYCMDKENFFKYTGKEIKNFMK